MIRWAAVAAVLCWIAVPFAISGERNLEALSECPDGHCISIGKMGCVDIGISVDPVCRTDFKGNEKVWGRPIIETVRARRPGKLKSPMFLISRQNDRSAVTADRTRRRPIPRHMRFQFSTNWFQKVAGNLELPSWAVANIPECHPDNQFCPTRRLRLGVGSAVKVWDAGRVDQFDIFYRDPRALASFADFIGRAGDCDGCFHFLGLAVRPFGKSYGLPPETDCRERQNYSESSDRVSGRFVYERKRSRPDNGTHKTASAYLFLVALAFTVLAVMAAKEGADWGAAVLGTIAMICYLLALQS